MSDNGPPNGIGRIADSGGNDDLSSWLGLIGQGDRLAFKKLYDAVSPRLFGQAMKLMRSREAAEDVLQETFLRIWASAGHFDPAYGHALAWLARVTRNVAIDHLRRLRKAQRYFVPEDEAPGEPVAPEPVEDRLDLEKALNALPTPQREAICSIVVEGRTHEETAIRGGIPVPTVKSRAQRGLKRLRSTLEVDECEKGEPIQNGMATV
ncbi:RNA polymerase sigma factor [Aquisediminimonas profunda]|uniref:RNA polymerase sigma factor n=1 Tax=Aquisediminimonas profunda TaxID=1550733 RepID=UPI001C624FF5|nr:RNA polymerase sigma factor [Aquisediminimonas profunda]